MYLMAAWSGGFGYNKCAVLLSLLYLTVDETAVVYWLAHAASNASSDRMFSLTFTLTATTCSSAGSAKIVGSIPSEHTVTKKYTFSASDSA